MRAVAVLIASAAALVASTGASAATITRTAKTASYSLTLNVGPAETMYTQADAKMMHPKTGEVMIGGSMSMATSMKGMTGEVQRHLELHVTLRSTGAVVTNLLPSIAVSDTSAMAMTTTKLAVVAMQGVTKGPADRHYGNNVSLKPGDTYAVSVVVKGEKASFSFKAS
jgi:hypothetical protein